MTQTPTDPIAPTSELLKNIFDLVKLAIPADQHESADELITKVEANLKEASGAYLLLQQQVTKLQAKVSELDGQLNKANKDSRNLQISQTKDSVLVRTTKDSKSVSEYLQQMVGRAMGGTNNKPPAAAFPARLISSSGDPVKSPGKRGPLSQLTAPRGAPPTLLYKVHLGPYYKDLLFKGLASPRETRETRGSTNSDFSISHDTPLFLRKTRVTLEQCAYSLRKTHKEGLDIRTKVVLKDQNLRLFYNTKDSRVWVPANSTSAVGETHDVVRNTMYLTTKDSDPHGSKTVSEVMDSLHTF